MPYRRFVQTPPIEVESLVLQAAGIIHHAKEAGGQQLLNVLELLLVHERMQQAAVNEAETVPELRH